MDTFIKQVSGSYSLVHNYTSSLPAGEIIKSYNVYFDGVVMSGEFESSGVVASYTKYDNDTLLIGVQYGEDGSGYVISSDITTNRNNTYDKNTYLLIDEDDYPDSYDELNYRSFYSSSDKAVYILPELSNGFTYNNEYHVTVLPGFSGIYNSALEEGTSFWFTSQYCPLFTNITTIKLMGGPDIDGFSEDTIYRMIHKNSLDAMDMYNNTNGVFYSYDYYGCTPERVPYQLRRYVECKTAYDLLTLLNRISQDNRSQLKTLGDLTIKYGGTSGKASTADPGLMKNLYDCYMATTNIIGGGVKSAVRGLYDYSKGAPHPTQDDDHNRITRTVHPNRSNPTGPWEQAAYWRFNTRSSFRRNI